jgi:hypothetical protein
MLTLCLFALWPRQIVAAIPVKYRKSIFPHGRLIFLAGEQRFYSVNTLWSNVVFISLSLREDFARRQSIAAFKSFTWTECSGGAKRSVAAFVPSGRESIRFHAPVPLSRGRSASFPFAGPAFTPPVDRAFSK